MELSDHFFRHESGRIVATLTRIFGVHNLDLVEDVAQDAFCRAVETWRLHGLPPNPSAWLMTTAKNRALDALRRQRTARTFAPEYAKMLASEWTMVPMLEELLDSAAIKDDQLRLMFSCCHRQLPEPAQVALILHILCGFSVDEVASAFVSRHAAFEKRITRGKKVLAASKRLFDVSSREEFEERLPTVQRAIYLLFNEGYHGASPERTVRSELCNEAIRLVKILLDHPFGATPSSHALAALMCLHAARIPGRVSATGDLTPLFDQDRSLWDRARIEEGLRFLDLAAIGERISEYHVEAMIAALHAQAKTAEETDWARIVELYDFLLTLRPSPVVALNRAIATGYAQGPATALAGIWAIGDPKRFGKYPFYWAALAEFESRLGLCQDARTHLKTAISLARGPMERRFLERRLAGLLVG